MRHKRSRDAYRGWHLLANDKTLHYGHDKRTVTKGARIKMRPVPSKAAGLEADLPLLCQQGMHAARSIRHALSYSKARHEGRVLCRVLVEEALRYGDDKVVGRYRTVLWWRQVPLRLMKLRKAERAKAVRAWATRHGAR